MTPAQAQDYLVRRIEDEGPDMDLERALDEADRLEYEARGVCECCDDPCDTPPVCRDCDENGAT